MKEADIQLPLVSERSLKARLEFRCFFKLLQLTLERSYVAKWIYHAWQEMYAPLVHLSYTYERETRLQEHLELRLGLWGPRMKGLVRVLPSGDSKLGQLGRMPTVPLLLRGLPAAASLVVKRKINTFLFVVKNLKCTADKYYWLHVAKAIWYEVKKI